MANSTGHVIDTWVTEVRRPEPRFASDKWTNIAQDRKQIYSYGSHFPMARYMNDETGEWFLVNGDQYSVTTSSHQGHLRHAVRNSGLRFMIVPFSALREAQIDLDTIRYVYIGEDTYERVQHEVDDLNKLPRHMRYISPDSDGIFRWERSVHHLGASVFTARYVSDHKSKHHYSTVIDHDAMNRRYEIRRAENPEGNNTTWYDWDNRIMKRKRYTTQEPVYAEAYFLSAFDEQESPPLYFLAQLPEGSEPQSVHAAFEALKPELVRNAEAHSRVVTPEGDAFTVAGKVTRQGDVFAIPVEMSTAELKAAGATPVVTPPMDLSKMDPERYQRWRKNYKLGRTESWVLGVNHTASEVMTLGELTYARGTLRHRRVFRDFIGRGEHKRQRIGDGKTWALLVRNTVPYVHGQSRAWTVGGGVD